MPTAQSRTKRHLLALALLAGLLLPGLVGSLPALAAGSVSLVALGTPHSENFDTLASSGTANTAVPTGWEFSESGSNANTTYRAGTGSDNAGDTYSFGAASSSERAFGGLRSGSLVPLVGAQFTNNTGGTITGLDITYTGEQWRLGQNTTGRAADRLDFQLSTDATSIATGTWLDYEMLDFASPAVAGTVGAVDGNAAANRRTLSASITGLNIPSGATFWLRWADTDLTPGADDGLSVDDFVLVPQGNAADSAPAVVSTSPVNGAGDVAPSATIAVAFSEPVNLNGTWYTLLCSVGGVKTATVSGGPSSFALDPDIDFVAGESCTLTLSAAAITDQDGNDPPDNMVADVVIGFSVVDICALSYVPTYQIQGSGPAAAVTGVVTTQGVVVGDYEYPGSGSTNGFLRGFYLQDLAGDGDPATSDALFVFNGNNNRVNLGDVVRVTGTAGEFQNQTQVSATAIENCGTGGVAPVDVIFPVPSATYLEQFEGMLVRLPQTLYVTEHFQLGRFGQVVMSANGRLAQPTNVVTPGAAALALQAQNSLNRIIVDDASQAQNPDPILFGRGGLPLSASNTLRGGDTATGIVGVMSYTWAGNAASGNAYRVRPLNALGGSIPNFQPANPRPAGPPALAANQVRVAGMNLLNFFNTFDGLPDTADNCIGGVGGAATDCRGADTQAEFDRQWPKTVAAIVGSGADIVGVIEIENDGYGPDSALQSLVSRLDAATAAGTYAFVDVDVATGQLNALGSDAIKVGLIYKPGRVTPVGQTAALNSVAFVNGGDTSPRSRPALAQAFQEAGTGGRFVVVVNHLKSKGSACDVPDAGDGQGNCNAVRTNAVVELVNWLNANPTGTGDPDVLILGDLNAYAMEDPVSVLKTAGYINQVERFGGPGAYSYVFDGQWGYLDHALASPSLDRQVMAVADWHISADEPSVLDYNTDFKSAGQQASLYAPDVFRISDHDPVLVDVDVDAPPLASAGGPYSTVEGEIVTLTAAGMDPDGTPISFAWDLNNDNVFETSGQSVAFTAVDGAFVYPVRVLVTDATGQVAVAESTVSVANANPVVGVIAGPAAPTLVNSAVNVSAAFADAGVVDTHTARWDWGDGSTSAGVVSEAGGSGSVSGSHSYAAPGVYTVILTVTDKDGGSGQASLANVVAYNPDGGFVVGGGWIESPAGSYVVRPAATGKTIFGFVTRYKRAATVPSGHTQFQLHSARLNFASSGYEWLVVTGARAQFKGTGTINGAGGYNFLLTTLDGRLAADGVDRLRLKVWEGATGTVVYDSQPGAPDSADPVTALGGGSIVIHGGKTGGRIDDEGSVLATELPAPEWISQPHHVFLSTLMR